MARSDLLISLVEASSQGDQRLFRQTLEALIAEERAKQHFGVADKLAEYLRVGAFSPKEKLPKGSVAGDLLYEQNPRKTLSDLVLSDATRSIVDQLIDEQRRTDLLRSYGIEPRHRILLSGPPGNGKTSLAEAVAESLMLPMFTVRYENVVGSFLGETSQRIKSIFDHVRTRQCVLFFDEFDTVSKERGDIHETGEIKRVVSSLLLQIDALPSHVVVVAATNHPELLDRAVGRRFQVKLELSTPSKGEISQWVDRFQKRWDMYFGIESKVLAQKLEGISFSELEDFTLDVRRRYVLSLPDPNVKKITSDRLQSMKCRVAKPNKRKK